MLVSFHINPDPKNQYDQVVTRYCFLRPTPTGLNFKTDTSPQILFDAQSATSCIRPENFPFDDGFSDL